MSRWRLLIVLLFLALPFIFLVGVGSYFLWQSKWGFFTWWFLTACFAIGYFVAWNWQRKYQLLRRPTVNIDPQWTEQDNQAWELVKARAAKFAEAETASQSDPQFYLNGAQELALELARFYHPNAHDPVGWLTVPEILAAIELAAADLGQLVDQYVPGSHLLTINHWRKAKQAAGWYQKTSNAYWAASAALSPVNTGVRFLASKFGLSKPLQMLQENLLGWFASAYLERVGAHLIDLNSGRLKMGAAKYRELVKEQTAAETEQPSNEAPPSSNSYQAGKVLRKVLTTTKKLADVFRRRRSS